MSKRKNARGQEVLAILAGGGPAPGINGVIGSAALEACDRGLKVIGVRDGFKHLVKGDISKVVNLTPEKVTRIHLEGGSIIGMSRENPTKDKAKMANVVKALKALNVRHLITIGGDDTAYSSRRVAEELAGKVGVVHVPKTIDNDLPLKEPQPTFGYETARELGARLVQNLMEDAATTGRWYFVVAMGRSAGFLAMGIAKPVAAHLCLIPEEMRKNTPLKRVVDMIEAAMIKREAQGRPDGVVVVAEGVGLKLHPRTWKDEPLATIEYDDFGHIRLAEVDLAGMLRREIKKRYADRGRKITIVAKDIGYELRCAPPNAFDCEYTRDLGCGAVHYLLGELPSHKGPVMIGGMIAVEGGRIVIKDLEKLKDPKTGKTRVRRVRLNSDAYRVALRYQLRLRKSELEDEATLRKLAKTAGLSPAAFREKFGPIAQ